MKIRIRFDQRDRTPQVPDDLRAALRDADALPAWAASRPSRRKELLAALADAKREQTRKRRIARIVQAALKDGTRRG